jgi:hypothetical protein
MRLHIAHRSRGRVLESVMTRVSKCVLVRRREVGCEIPISAAMLRFLVKGSSRCSCRPRLNSILGFYFVEVSELVLRLVLQQAANYRAGHPRKAHDHN